MAGRPAGSDDQHELYLDNTVALAGFILDCVEEIKDITDDLDVLHVVLDIERHARIIQARTRRYRPLMRNLKATNRGLQKTIEQFEERAGSLPETANRPGNK